MHPTMLQGHLPVAIKEGDTEDDVVFEVVEDKDHLEVVLINMHIEKEMLPILKLHNAYGNAFSVNWTHTRPLTAVN